MSKYTLEELTGLCGLTRRTIRYYIQIGLVARPLGERKAAYYSEAHLERLLRVKRLTAEGFSLERVRALLLAPEAVPAPAPQPGQVSVRTHVFLTNGVELAIDPAQAGLSAEQLRALARTIIREIDALKANKKEENGNDNH